MSDNLTRQGPDSGEWLTVSQAAARLGVNVRTVRRRCESGKLTAKLKPTDTGHAWFIDPASPGVASDRSDATSDRSDSLGQGSDDDRTDKVSDVSGTSDGIGQTSDTRLSRLEGYAARDLELVIAQAVGAAVREAVEPLQAQIEALRAQVEKLTESRSESPESPQSAASVVESQPAAASAQRPGERPATPRRITVGEVVLAWLGWRK